MNKNTKEKKLKIIFLDVDGVLNCNSTHDVFNGYIGIEDKKVSLLKQIVDSTDANIVLVSTWKEWWHKETNLKENQDSQANYLDEKMKRHGLTIVDKTYDNWSNRGEGILNYLIELKEIGFEVDKFIILDDETFDYKEKNLIKNLIRTGFYSGGLQGKHVTRAIDKLLEN